MYRKRRQAGLLFLLSLFSVIANRVNAEFFELQVLIELVCIAVLFCSESCWVVSVFVNSRIATRCLISLKLGPLRSVFDMSFRIAPFYLEVFTLFL